MNTEFFNALDLLEKEKGIPKDFMLQKVEAAIQSAYKRESGGASNIRVVLDPEKKEVKVFEQRMVVEEITDEKTEILLADAKKISKKYKLGDVVETEVKTKNFKRMSAQNAKQSIIQGIREAEKMMIIKEYENKREEVVTATVDRIDPENGDAIVIIGNKRAVLRHSEQIPGEDLEPGDMIKVYVVEVNSETKGSIVTLSRSHFGLVKRLFELEIPEIEDGTVVIRAVAREAGSRTKIAVESNDPNVDPVGACIGNKGSRINDIVDELRGEKIDVISYSDKPEEFVAAALSPATVISVTMDGERSCKAVVPYDQLSLAIGGGGQNVRLSAKLTGLKIDIISDEN